jgi:hypothetical protein
MFTRAADAIQIDHRRAPIMGMVVSNHKNIKGTLIFQNSLVNPIVMMMQLYLRK